MLIGEAPGDTEDRIGRPFLGEAGHILDGMLDELSIDRNECFITNVCKYRPPHNKIVNWMPEVKKDVTPDMVFLIDRMVKPQVMEGYNELLQEIEIVKPKLIIAFGNVPLWALTGKWGILSWRGSQMRYKGIRLLPTAHPAFLLRSWEWRFWIMLDLKRAFRKTEEEWQEPHREIRVRPSFVQTTNFLTTLLDCLEFGSVGPVAADIETRRQQIACIGLGLSADKAFCIPFLSPSHKDYSYWNRSEELQIIELLQRVLPHPRMRIIGQNFSYDTQHILKQWGIVPNLWRDTLVTQHLLFPGTPLDLSHLSTAHCEHHYYWKDEGKEWHPGVPEEQLWNYNGLDCCKTFEVYESQAKLIEEFGLGEKLEEVHQHWWCAMYAMKRGVLYDDGARPELGVELDQKLQYFDQYFKDVLHHSLNPQSPHQMKRLFYEDLKLPKIYKRKANKAGIRPVTCDDEALEEMGLKYPELRGFIAAISLQRTTRTLKSTFVEKGPDADRRMRTAYGITADTFRLTSSENVFGGGTNLQNLPSSKSKSTGKAVRRSKWFGERFKFPNVRRLYLPDPGMEFWDGDLDRADMQVVAWEADEPELKKLLKLGVDIHLYNAFTLQRLQPPSLEDLIEGQPAYAEHRKRHSHMREFSKTWGHGTDYGGSARTMAINSRIPVRDSENYRAIYFERYPGIPQWQERIQYELETTRRVTNKFGYSIYFFGRVEGLLGEALAWNPQSTVALVTRIAWARIMAYEPLIEVLLQSHDALEGQYPIEHRDYCLSAIKRHMSVVVPYEDPLIIPVGIKTSTLSWGHCGEDKE